MKREACKWLVAALSVAIVANAAANELGDVKPDPLLVVDQSRTTVVERIEKAWATQFEQSAGMSKEQFREMLMGLRADYLLAASLSGSLEGLRDVLAKSTLENGVAKEGTVRMKALGDSNRDLVYTPLVPCRIADTRNAVGALTANVSRNLVGFSANFSAQGGTATNCAIPANVSALAMNVYAVNATGTGYIKLWPQGSPEPAVSTVNYQSGFVAIATGAIVPVNGAANNGFVAKSVLNIDFIADVVGYFAAPAGNALPKVTHVVTNTSDTTAIPTTCVNYSGGSITINAPVAGKIVVRANTVVQQFHTNGTTPRAQVHIGTSPTDCAYIYGFAIYIQLPASAPTGTYEPWTSQFREFSVGPGTYTYYLNGSATSAGVFQFWYAAMEATFIPN